MTDHDALSTSPGVGADAVAPPAPEQARGPRTPQLGALAHPHSWRSTSRWRVGLLVGFFLLLGATRTAPYAVVTPGIAVDLMAAVTASATAPVDPGFGRGGRFLATTIEATSATYATVVLCIITGPCELYPLDTSGAGASEEAAMAASQAAALADADRLAGPAPAYPHGAGAGADMGPVAGSSAGVMVSLALLDAATPGDLTGGARVAGTGTLGADGAVLPIGGVSDKVVAAASSRASVFFAPAAQAGQAAAQAKLLGGHITVVPVVSTDQALAWLCAHAGTSTACPLAAAPGRP